MPQTSWPFDNIDTSETQFSYLMKAGFGQGYAGVVGVPGDTQLKITAAGTGLAVNIAAGFALIRGFMYYLDAPTTLTLNTVSANRYDRIVLRLDPVANSIVPAVVQGTGAASPVLPNLAQTDTGLYEFELANILLTAGTVNASAGTLVDTRQFVGEQVGKWTTATRPAGALLGRTGWNTTLASLETWNGSAWVQAGSSGPSPLMLMGA